MRGLIIVSLCLYSAGGYVITEFYRRLGWGLSCLVSDERSSQAIQTIGVPIDRHWLKRVGFGLSYSGKGVHSPSASSSSSPPLHLLFFFPPFLLHLYLVTYIHIYIHT